MPYLGDEQPQQSSPASNMHYWAQNDQDRPHYVWSFRLETQSLSITKWIEAATCQARRIRAMPRSAIRPPLHQNPSWHTRHCFNDSTDWRGDAESTSCLSLAFLKRHGSCPVSWLSESPRYSFSSPFIRSRVSTSTYRWPEGRVSTRKVDNSTLTRYAPSFSSSIWTIESNQCAWRLAFRLR